MLRTFLSYRLESLFFTAIFPISYLHLGICFVSPKRQITTNINIKVPVDLKLQVRRYTGALTFI